MLVLKYFDSIFWGLSSAFRNHLVEEKSPWFNAGPFVLSTRILRKILLCILALSLPFHCSSAKVLIKSLMSVYFFSNEISTFQIFKLHSLIFYLNRCKVWQVFCGMKDFCLLGSVSACTPAPCTAEARGRCPAKPRARAPSPLRLSGQPVWLSEAPWAVHFLQGSLSAPAQSDPRGFPELAGALMEETAIRWELSQEGLFSLENSSSSGLHCFHNFLMPLKI